MQSGRPADCLAARHAVFVSPSTGRTARLLQLAGHPTLPRLVLLLKLTAGFVAVYAARRIDGDNVDDSVDIFDTAVMTADRNQTQVIVVQLAN